MAAVPHFAAADSYSQLWKQVEEAQKKDLPKTQIALLGQIADRAEANADYGQLLKASLRTNELWAMISPDSVAPALTRTEAKAMSVEAKDPALAAIYYAVLGSYYKNTYSLQKDSPDKAKAYFAKAMAKPALLASKKATDYEPFVVKGRDSQLFNHDLLSLIGYQCEAYKTLHDYYKTTKNRAATLITALRMIEQQSIANGRINVRLLKKSKYIVKLDSLINRYSDLNACGEVAIERYFAMAACTDVKPADKYNYINWALSRWGDWPGMNRLRNAQKQLINPYFSLNVSENMPYPGTAMKMPVTVRNIKKLTVVFTKTTLNGGSNFTPLSSNWEKEQRKYMIGSTARTVTHTFVGRPEYEETTDTLTFSGLPAGVYIVDAYADGRKTDIQSNFLFVSSLYVACQELPGGKTRLVALDSKTGQPAAGATIVVRGNDLGKTSLKCDAKGETVFSAKGKSLNEARAYTAADNACPFIERNSWFSYSADDRPQDNIRLFTDRSVYRPGQTVHASLIAYSRKSDDAKTLSGRKITLQLRDANRKVVTEKELVTDSLGTASADFALPLGGLTGRYLIATNTDPYGSTTFRVEEYKRPTFTVELPEVNRRYQNGDTLVVTGHAKTYAGVPVQGATVKYSVRREQAVWWRMGLNGFSDNDNGGLLDEQTTTTDSTGAFKMELPMVLPEWEEANAGIDEAEFRHIGLFYNITANVDVTDVAGETRSASMSIPLGSKPTSFSVELPGLQLRDSLKTVRFNYRNMAGRDISGTVRYWIDGSNRTYQAETNTAVPAEWNTAGMLKSGIHTLKAICGTDTLTQKFTVFSLDDTVPCTETHDWYYLSDSKFHNDGTPVYLQIGSSDKDVHILYTAVSGDTLIESGSFDISNSIKTRALKYNKMYGDALRMTFFWMKEGKIYSHNSLIEKPLPDKRLTVKWGTFRDKTVPGAREEWTLNITKPDGTPADASLMATLYDASLDQIAQHSWAFSLGLYRPNPYCRWSTNQSYGCNFDYSARLRRLDETAMKLSWMNFGSNLTTWGGMRIRGTRAFTGAANGRAYGELLATEEISAQPMAKFSAPIIQKHAAVKSDRVQAPELDVVNNANGDRDKNSAKQASAKGEVQLRENLNETAYFAPALRTDAKGNVVMRFTLPESITTWRFMGLAHDRLMNYGSISGETVAKKTVMIQPNMPRFVRSGDKATITARVINTSSNAVSGDARIELTDPETGATVMDKVTPFKLGANATGSVSFSYNPTDEYQMLVCKVTAAGVSFSDGEQHYLPVLPDKEMVLTTMPFTQTTPGVQTVDLKPLFPKGATHKRLTVEYTNNPSWLVIQALPYIGTVRNENIMSLSTAFYANTLGSYIVSKTPRLKSAFEQWKQETTDKEGSLASSLEKNKELKTIVLDETPWVAEADREAGQKRSLGNYFDINLLQSRNSTIIESMRKLQNTDGSWSWWPGMKGSYCLTMTVARQLARLEKLTGSIAGAKAMLDNASNYIGKQAVKEYEEALKQKKKYGNGAVSESFALNYLYINAMTGRKPAAKEAEAAGYMLTQLKNADARTDLFTKALMAVVLAQNGEKTLAAQYLQSLEEYTVATETMGRYYDTGRAGYSWCDFRIPTQVAAIEAMTLIDAPKYRTTITEMQRWLLQQKHTQGWDTPIQSADAIYAFINGNTAALDSQPHTVLKVDGRQLETSSATAAIGYVKATVDAERAGRLTADKTSTGTSWGAVYARSMQNTKDIEGAKSGLDITREIVTSDGNTAKTLRTGDRVKVRITIMADRDYDFVQVKDNRAACMEPVSQLSGYRNGCYCAPKDNATYYYFDHMSKGKHTIETEYYVDRAGVYQTGTCSVQCAYSPEFTARTASEDLEIK